jgi:argininosuccinate lyase
MGEAINKGDYHPKRRLDHTHLGSLGNLALDEIQTKMEQAFNS